MAAPPRECIEEIKDFAAGLCAAGGYDASGPVGALEAAYPTVPGQDETAHNAAVRARIARFVGDDVKIYTKLNDLIHRFINREAARVLPVEQYEKTASVRGGLRRAERITAPHLRPLVVPNGIIALFDNSIVRQNEVAKHYEMEYAAHPTEALREANERHAYYRETFLKMRDLLVQRRAVPVAASA